MTEAVEARGRPSIYSQEVADEICARLMTGETLRAVCRDEGMPHESTVRLWAAEDREGFYTQYTKAREAGYLAMADELLEIADDGRNDWVVDEEGGDKYNGDHVQRSRLRVDTRKWLLSKALPKVFGDKLALGGDADMPPIQTEEVGQGAAKLAAYLDSIAERSGTSGEPDGE